MAERIQPFVSVVVPCRNERDHVDACLASILGNDYPAESLEVVVVDGMSDDGTRERILAAAAAHPAVRLLDNPSRVTPVALNLGIAATQGDVVIRMDAHVRYPRDYIRRLVDALETSGADNVGGVLRTLPGGRGPLAQAIAMGMAHPFGVGNAAFRTGARAWSWVDTVPFGCFRRSLFERLGGFDPELVRNQDDEMNGRIIRAGGRILLVPDIVVEYFARNTLGKLARMYYQYGYYKPLVVRKLGLLPTARQLVPPALLLAVAGAALLAGVMPAVGRPALGLVTGAYLLGVITAAAGAWWRTRRAAALFLVAVFPVLHGAYGWGYLRGVVPALRHGHGASHAGDVALTR